MENETATIEKIEYEGFDVLQYRVPEEDFPMAKIAVFVGHSGGKSNSDGGAYSKTLGMGEWTYNLPVAFAYADEAVSCGLDCDVFVRSEPGWKGWKPMKDQLNKNHAEDPYALHLMLHFNAYNERFHGSFTMYWHKSKNGKRAATIFTKVVSEHFNVVARDPRGLKPKMRANHLVKLGHMPSVIVEAAFGSNVDDAKKLFAGRDTYHEALMEATLIYLDF